MRTSACVLSLLLLLAPLGLAQDGGSGSPSHSPQPGPCEADARCRPQGNGTTGNSTRVGEHDGGVEPPGCRDGEHDDAQAARCEHAVRQIRDERGRHWIAFEVDAANATLIDYTVAGLLALEELHLDLDDGNLTIDRQGSTLRVRDGEAELRLHDEPNGLIRFKGAEGNVTLTFPANTTIERGEHGARIAYVGGREGHLLADNATWLDNETVLLNGFFAFHVPPGQGHDGPAGDGAHEDAQHEELEERKQEAIERRTFGAEITLKPREMRADLAALNDSVQVLAYDDVDVDVDLPDAAATPDRPIRVVVSSELDEGRTIVLNLDEGLLASTRPADLLLSYYDLHNQTNGSVLEIEVVFRAAASLQDVLNPSDDDGPEFWVVEDANGVQVLVSVPHWSAHAITVASLVTTLHAPSVVVGIVAGVAASALAGTLLLWPRRRDDEL